MAKIETLAQAGLLAFVIFSSLNLQGTVAQRNCNCTTTDTPRWAVAVIVMLSIALALYIISCCIMPLCAKLCCKSRDPCQSGCSYGR